MASYLRRRKFLGTLGGAAVAWPLAARAQQPATPVMASTSRDTDTPFVAAFHRGLNETGYVEGQNLAIESQRPGRDRVRCRRSLHELVVRVYARPLSRLSSGSQHLENSDSRASQGPAAIVRDFVKWDDQPASLQHFAARRAFRCGTQGDADERLRGASLRHRVPAIYAWRVSALAGGLISYGGSQAEAYHQAGIYAGRVLKGDKPADLPVQAPTKYELVINLKTAKALGIEIPSSVPARADEVIE
jgi:hypothetical protein